MASFRDILNYYRPYKTLAIVSILASSIFEVIDLIVPYATGQILNVLSNQALDRPILLLTQQIQPLFPLTEEKFLSLGVLLTLIFVVTVVRAPIQPWLGIWFHWEIPLKARRDQFKKVIAKILTLPLSFYDQNNPGRIAGRVARGVTNLTWSYPEIAGQFIPKLVRILGIFLVIWLVSWWIAIAFLSSFILIIVLNFQSLRLLIKKEEIVDNHQENTESRTSEIITNIKTVKAFATEASELKRQSQRLDKEYKSTVYGIHLGYVKLATWTKTVVEGCMFLILLCILIPTVKGEISLGYFITTLTVASMAYSEISPITNLAEAFARRYSSMMRFHDFMKLAPGTDAASLIPEKPENNPYSFTGKIEFSHVSFGYDQKRLVLKDINLLIQPNETVAFVGRSGSGKSTLIKLLFRYFEPTQGYILIDGEKISSLDVARYRRRLAIVHQDVDIFNGTVYENLIYGNPQASGDAVVQACEIARVEEFIHQLPKGYQTMVGERGVRLSGGQKQRLGIARALIINPDVLLFDEATSSLDYESERAIQLAMSSILGTRTTIIIAHRLSTIREADKIVVLDKGEIVEVGSHEELLNHQGVYQRLHSLQETGEILA